MKPLLIVTALLLVASTPMFGGLPRESAGLVLATGRFATVPVYIDSGDAPLAAYQFQLSEQEGRMRVVGVEGGEHPAYADAPYFDRQAVDQGRADRIIVAAFSTQPANALPVGRTRVAAIHVYVTGIDDPQWRLALIRAGDTDGQPIDAAIDIGSEANR